MTNSILVLLFALCSLNAFSIEGQWSIMAVNTKIIKKGKSYVSSNCQEDCEALKSTTLIHKDILKRANLKGGKNPGAVICKKIGGKVLLGLDNEKNQNTFCYFEKDNTLISSGSISNIFYSALAD